jgi:hypothetical protein
MTKNENPTCCAKALQLLAAWGAACLLAACGGGGSGGGGGGDDFTGSVVVSGTATYESVPNSATGSLNYGARSFKPVRGATVELINTSGGAVLGTATTSATGTYSFAAITGPGTPVAVRVRAELKADAPATDISVRDNTCGAVAAGCTAATAALYAVQSSNVRLSGATQTIDVRAGSGWGGSSYTAPRAAGPFAVLDAIYSGVQKVRAAVPAQALAPLRVMWSPNNTPAGGDTEEELARGEIGTSFFLDDATGRRIYLLGAANTDTDEYDSHVVVHEWGHYLQSAVSRDDSVGGEHGGDDKLDMRVAFSEGFGNALSGMVLASPRYADSAGAAQGSGFILDVSQNPSPTDRGWFSESSVQHLMWQWHENTSIGFAPLYQVLTGPMRSSAPIVAIHNFAHRLKAAVPAQVSAIDATLAAQSITVQDEWGTGESNIGGVAESVPVNTAILNGSASVCTSNAAGTPNKLRNFVNLRFTTAAAGNVTVRVAPDGYTGGDPDFVLIGADGVTRLGQDTKADLETSTLSLPAGTHALIVNEFKLPDRVLPAPAVERCLNVTIN